MPDELKFAGYLPGSGSFPSSFASYLLNQTADNQIHRLVLT